MDHTKGLNPQQKQAVLHTNGPLLIIAGAGAGKTKTLTHRIVQLIESGVAPNKILAITFTNKAAKEMRDRVESLIKTSGVVDDKDNTFYNKPFVSTFHSLGVHILREKGDRLGLPKHFTISDQKDTLATIKEAIKACDLDPKRFEPKKIHNIISKQKNDLITLDVFKENAGDNFFHSIVAPIWQKYEKFLTERKALDFDDLIQKPVLLLQKEKDIREYYQKKWSHVHIDEYQDTNTVQYKLSQLLIDTGQNICVVGDTDQCFPKDTPVLLKHGKKKIQDVQTNDEVTCASGGGDLCTSRVTKVRKRSYAGTLLKITTKSGKIVETTPEHIFFSRFNPPQGTTKGNTANERLNVRLVMFGDKRKSARHPFGLSRVSINTTSVELKNKLEVLGFKTRKGKRDDWRLEIARLDYGKAEVIASKLLTIDPNLILNRTALLTGHGRFLFLPAASLREHMEIPLVKKGGVIVDEIKSIEKKKYTGNVYDLDIDKTHNYIVNSIPVHNCVYSWRGANIKNLLTFEKDYPETKTILLEQNYRSTQIILGAANQIIKKNELRVEKKLFTKNKEGDKISLFDAFDEGDESRFVAREARNAIKDGVAPSNIAVLYRANFQSRALEEAFLTVGVPYQVLGVKFFDRKEVKDILSYLKAALNPDSLYDIKRIINVPTRGIGKVTLGKIFAGKEHELAPKMREKITKFREILSDIEKESGNKKTSDLIKFILKRSGLEKILSGGNEEDAERLENIRELVTLAVKYDIYPPEEGLEKLLADAALATDQDSLEKPNEAVKLMTVHAAKGLEFAHVFITGLEQDLFPHSNMDGSKKNREEQEEERRLFYVALTRAEEKLYLSFASVRTIFGSKQVNIPSEFLTDIDEEFIEPVREEGTDLESSPEKVVYLEL